MSVGGVTVRPGDVVFGDADGVLVGSLEAWEDVVWKAEAVANIEERIMDALNSGAGDLTTMSNVVEHVEAMKLARWQKNGRGGSAVSSRLNFDSVPETLPAITNGGWRSRMGGDGANGTGGSAEMSLVSEHRAMTTAMAASDLVELDAPRIIVEAMERHGEDAKAVTAACGALEALLSEGRGG